MKAGSFASIDLVRARLTRRRAQEVVPGDDRAARSAAIGSRASFQHDDVLDDVAASRAAPRRRSSSDRTSLPLR